MDIRIRQRILERFKHTCQHCGSKNQLEIDHIIPISRNGKENENNMQVLCKICNLKKGKSIDINRYFKESEDKDCLLLRRDFPVYALKSKELTSILEEKFEELCGTLSEQQFGQEKP